MGCCASKIQSISCYHSQMATKKSQRFRYILCELLVTLFVMLLPFCPWFCLSCAPFYQPRLSVFLCWADGSHTASFCAPVMVLFNLPVFSAPVSDCFVQVLWTSFLLPAYGLHKPCWCNTWATDSEKECFWLPKKRRVSVYWRRAFSVN